MKYGARELRSPGEWKHVVGLDKWRPRYSAFELAHKWHPARNFPPVVSKALQAEGNPAHLRNLTVRYCLVEWPVFLDTDKAPSRTDLMVYARTKDKDAVIVGVEGKAREPFGQRVDAWVRGLSDGQPTAGVSPKPSRLRRLQFLSTVLDREVSADSKLRYQLLHRTASVLLESRLQGAVAGLLIVHAFPGADGSWADFEKFTTFLDVKVVRGQLSVPVSVAGTPKVPLYFLWVDDQCEGVPNFRLQRSRARVARSGR